MGATALVVLAAGCRQTDTPDGAPTTPASARPPSPLAGKSTITVTGARLVLPAVNGRPGAVYFTLTNTGVRTETLVAANVRGAHDAQMHETSGGAMTPLRSVPVAARGSVAFAPGGRHVMVFGVPDDLRPGATSELRLTFGDGERFIVPLTVQAPGSGGDLKSDGMAGMKMTP